MLKKLPLLVSFLLVLALVLGSGFTASITQGQEEVTLRFSWWGNPTRDERTLQVIELFQAQYPWITVEAEPSNWDDHWIMMQSQGEGGNLPDLVQNDYSRLETWVTNGWLQPLDDFVNDKTIDLSSVSKASIESGKVDNTLYAVSMGSNSLGVMIDLDAFEQAGIAVPSSTWSWNDFEELCSSLHEKLDRWCIGPNLTLDVTWISLWLGYGETGYAPDGSGLGYTDDQPYIDFLHMLLRLQETRAIPSLAEAMGLADQPIITGEAAMAEVWSNQMVSIWNQAGEDRHFTMVHLPRPADGCCSSNYVKPAQFLTISANSQHPQEAALLINFFTNSLEANQVLLAERGVPVSIIVQKDLAQYVSTAQVEMFEFLARVQDDNSPLPPPDPAEHQTIYNDVFTAQMINPVLFGEITPEDAVATFREEATKILSEQ